LKQLSISVFSRKGAKETPSEQSAFIFAFLASFVSLREKLDGLIPLASISELLPLSAKIVVMPPRLAFVGIVVLYLWLAALYAIRTPRWQAPDEPAHYNYVRFIVEQGALPVLQTGDYNQAYLAELTSKKFPPELTIDAVRYEAWQPPLYYLLAAPIYKVSATASLDARLIALRLFTALWGVVLLALVYQIARTMFPSDALLPLFAVALVAFVPQHIAMTASVNNDILGEGVLAGIVLCLVKILNEGHRGKQRSGALALAEISGNKEPLGEIRGNRLWWVVGLLVGVGFVTKLTAYVSVGLVAFTLLLLWRNWRMTTRNSQLATRNYQLPLLLALSLGALWWGRNAFTYGVFDWLGQGRHNAIVIGQPTTLGLYGDYLTAATHLFPTLFRSFWGQFGWMATPMEPRTYNVLFVFTLFALGGLVLGKYQVASGKWQMANANYPTSNLQLQLLLVWLWLILALVLYYNLEFYQAQGRYLFPALGAIAIVMALGLRAWVKLAASLLARLKIPYALTEWVSLGVFVAGFVALDWMCLYRYVIPNLS
jgi:4-amino-4-deoxy-L-arabinose transferase-like glycosyltransferase